MREIRSYGTVGGLGGNAQVYPEQPGGVCLGMVNGAWLMVDGKQGLRSRQFAIQPWRAPEGGHQTRLRSRAAQAFSQGLRRGTRRAGSCATFLHPPNLTL